MTKKTYAEKLLSPKWQRKRLQILERDNFECKICNDKETTLHAHHIVYLKNKEPWDYPNELLFTICKNCHGRIKEKNIDYVGSLISHVLQYGITDYAIFMIESPLWAHAYLISIINQDEQYDIWIKEQEYFRKLDEEKKLNSNGA